MHRKHAVPAGAHAGHPVPWRQAGCLAGLAFCLVLTACDRREPAVSGKTEPAPLARVGGESVTQADFDFEVRRRLATGRPVGSPLSVVQDLVERQAMLQEAARAPWMNEPEARRERENQMLAQWLDRTLQADKQRVSVSDEEIRAYLREHEAQFKRPAMVRLAILYRRMTPQDTKDTRESLSAELQRARQEFLRDRAAATQSGRIPGFGSVAAQASEDTVSRYRGGDLGWVDTGRRDLRWPAAVMEAGSALPVGGVSEVLAAGNGLYVVMKQDQREAQAAPFEEVAAVLRRQLIRQKEEALERTFRSNLLARVAVEMDTNRVVSLTIPAEGRGPRPPVPHPIAGESSVP